MGDVANILGLKAPTTSTEETLRMLTEGKTKVVKSKAVKPAGMAREVFQLVADNSLAPSIQPAKIMTPAYKTKRANAPKGKWQWVAFTNSART